ncbi:MAG: GNAT family N-acetyltransferase [Rhodanobacteraceae bacterium]|nr:GNAT family N-acetyltransferase [Pseudomonadota bacterium]
MTRTQTPAKRRAPEIALRIRAADASDDDFILSLIPRFVDFALPPWRKRTDCAAGIRRDLIRTLREPPAGEALFVAEDDNGERVGFLRLQKTRDFFSGKNNCHISDLVVAPGHDGRGIGCALLGHAHVWAKRQRCGLITLAVFPRNVRARALYERSGFEPDLLRLAKPVRSRASRV